MDQEAIIQSIYSAIHDCVGIGFEEMHKESEIVDELEMNSLEILSMISALEKQYRVHFSTKALREIFTIEDLANYIISLKA